MIIFLSQLPEGWDYSCVSPFLVDSLLVSRGREQIVSCEQIVKLCYHGHSCVAAVSSRSLVGQPLGLPSPPLSWSAAYKTYFPSHPLGLCTSSSGFRPTSGSGSISSHGLSNVTCSPAFWFCIGDWLRSFSARTAVISTQPNLLTAFALSSGACFCYEDMKDLESQDTLKTGAKKIKVHVEQTYIISVGQIYL